MPFWIGVMAVAGLYRRSFYHRFFKELAALTFTAAIGIMALITLDFALDKPLFPARLVPLYAFGLTLTFLIFGRLVLRTIKFIAAKRGKGLTRVLIIGNGSIAPKIYESIVNGHNEYRLEGIWMPEPKGNQKRDFRPTQALHIKSFKTALKRITDRHADLVIQTEVLDDESNYQLTSAVESVHARYKLIPSNSSLYGIKTTTDLFFGIPSLDVHITPLVGWNTVLKRIFDITLSLIILIIASPFLLILAILIKISDFRGPVIYKHSRITRYGKTFYIYKFRSMYWKYCTGQKSGKKKTEIQIFTENPPPIPDNWGASPGEGWEWKGKGQPESGKGNWVNPETGQKIHPDAHHLPPKGPHWGLTNPDGTKWDYFPNTGKWEPSK